MTNQSSISADFARVRFTADVELDAQPVQLAFMADESKPEEADWRTATWLTPAGTTRTAGVMVGPGYLVLAVGQWRVWWRITDTPEKPADRAGTLTIT